MAAPTGSTFVGAVDQGTSSTRFLIFDSQTGALLTYHQVSVNHIYPHEGWVEEDPYEILNSVYECIEKAVDNLKVLGLDPKCIKAIGITNQRETTVVWDNETGKPLYNAIVWMDARNGETARKLIESTPGNNKDHLKARCGLPISTYFSAVKMRWLLDNSDTVRKAVSEGRCCFGTVDSWLIWNLTKKSDQKGSIHVTDVTNASRTMLMNIHSLQWDPELYKFFNIPPEILPQIRSSSEIYGHMEHTVLKGVPISGVLGDQQAALVGQMCLKAGQAKNTYGTGCFLLYNTGTEVVMSDHGLLTTVAYQLGPGKPVYYALEGSVAVTGAAVQWLRDNLGIVQSSADIETLAASVDDTHGCYFVPAFTGLFCPYWEYDARGIICGLTQFSTKAHIARACLEATCFQTRELLDAMNQDSGISLKSLQVDGGMTANNLLMQLQADITGLTIERPSMVETTALGAAIAAGSAPDVDVWRADKKQAMGMESFVATTTEADRNRRLQRWKEAVKRSMGWAREEHSQSGEQFSSIYTSMPLGFYVLSSFLIYLVTQRSSV